MHSDLDADDLRIISHIANGQTMSVIARKLGVTPQRISQRITRMEKIYKTALVHRKGGLSLTQAGLLLLPLAQTMEREVIAVKKNLAALQSDHGQLRIIAITSAILDHVPLALKNVLKEYKHLRVTLTHGTADQIIKAVETDKADVGLIGMTRQVDGLTFMPYRRERLYLLTHPDHPLAQKDAMNFSEASEYGFIDLDNSNIMSTLLNAGEMRTRIVLNRTIRASDLEIAAHYACQDFGITMTLQSIAERHQRNGLGKAIRLKDNWASVEIASCTKKVSRQSAAIRFFLSELEKRSKPEN
jgi:DNA-binding transcriptional LysR family regulator